MPSTFLSEIIVIIAAAFVGGFIARTLKFPPVLGYIASGIIFGIIGKSFFASYESLLSLSQIGVSLLLFTLGFEISLDSLRKINKKIFFVGLLQIFLVSAALFPLFLIFKFDFRVAVLFSILFSFSSTAVVIKLLEERGLLNDFPGNNVFIFLLIQDLSIIPIIFLLPVLFSKTGISSLSIFDFLVAAIKPLIIFAGILLMIKFFLYRFLNLLFRYPSHELTILATIFTATISILLFSIVGLPQSIAAFLAGVLISEQGKNLAPLTEIRPFRDLFLVLFFVLTGMLLNFNFFFNNFFLIFSLSIIIVLIKFAVIYLSLRFSGYSPSSGVFVSSYLSNVGEFAVVIGQIAFLSGFISSQNYNFLLSFFILSLIYIPFWLNYLRVGAERLARVGMLKKILPNETRMSGAANHSFTNHVVICGHGRVGKEVRELLDLANIAYIVIDFNRKVINDLNALSRYAIYGDPTDSDILKASFIDSAKVLVIAVPDSFSQKKIIDAALKFNPKLIILCRSHIEEDRYDLINMGVNTIIVPELEAGLRIGSEVLDLFNTAPQDIEVYVKRLRRQHLL